jgi:hypothetical protein
MPSRFYNNLKSRQSTLEQVFLGEYPDPAVEETSDKFRIAGFIAAFHGEIELYFEDVLETINEKAKNQFLINNYISKVAHFLVAHFCKNSDYFRASDRDKILSYFSKYETFISDNNGIRISNLNKLLIPIGLTVEDFDSQLIGDLDSYGNARGDLVHGVRDPALARLDRARELRKANNILTSLANVDNVLLARIRDASR